ncbi:MAG: choice-of-anchor Q domain-containing protein [Bacteroidales bacterium]|nr:choice-of-anchor Q domain-containing protein [Bacteroidales bacterium]
MKKLKFTLITLLIALFSASVNATGYFVKTDGNDANDGLSWATAKLTIAAGNTAAVSGDTVFVAGGTYLLTAVIKPKPGVNVYGGYDATTGLRDLSNQETIMNGQGNRILQISSSSPVNEATLWDGFTITGGNKTSEGGGVSLASAFFTLSNCKITGNTGSYGGGVNAAGCKIINCIIENNTAIKGGGVYAYDGSGTIIENCIIRNNITTSADALLGGGGIIVGGTTVMQNCLVYNNESLTVAGGCDVQKAGSVINCTFVNNKSPNSGGVRIGYNATVGGSITFQNNIVWNNSSASEFIAPSGSFQNIITSAFESGAPDGSINLSAANLDVTGPNFVSPSSAVGFTAVPEEIIAINAADWRLKVASPCIDAGTSTNAPITSLGGITRPTASGFEMGAYENTSRKFVKTDGNDANDGLSWATAKLTIAAMNAAVSSGDTVYVAGGTYLLAGVIKPKPGASVFGGYDAVTGLRDLTNQETILNGQGNRILQISSSSPVNEPTLWDGFTITGGNKTSEGGGVSLASAFFTLSNCKITGNTGSYGGGINAAGCKIINCIIENNTAIKGGGVYAYDGSGTIIENCIIRNNITTSADALVGGGGIIVGGTAVMKNCLVYNNESLTVAGGCDVQKAGQVINCTFVNNKSPNSGGVRIGYNATVGGSITFQNNIVWNNSSASEFIAPSGSFQNIITSACESGAPDGSINLSAANLDASGPNFVSPSSVVGFTAVPEEIIAINAADWRLKIASPCIDAGTSTNAPITSLGGIARPTAAGFEMGAYENTSRKFVKTDGNDSNDGLSWATAKLTIAAVNAAATSGDTVYVAGGTYLLAGVIKPKPGTSVFGGYDAVTGLRDLTNQETILNGQGNRILQISSSSPVNEATLWDGFTITGGNKTSEGGGVSLASAFFTLSNCKITGNTGSYGGGVNAAGCKLINCIIENNTAIKGGGVYAYDGSGTIIENCIIRNNKTTSADALLGGGGIIVGGTTVMQNCLVYNNESLTVAGGCDVQKAGSVINCTFVNNKSPNSGGVRIGYNATVGGSITFQNNIVWNNSSASEFIAPSGSTQNIITSAFESGAPAGSINLSAVNLDATGPIFASPTSVVGFTAVPEEVVTINAADWRLNAGSPCIDAGTSTNAPATSLGGIPRPTNGAFDMGAYESDLVTGLAATKNQKAFTIYPNPVSNAATFNVTGAKSVKVFDMAGRAINLPFINSRADVSGLTKGIYTMVVYTGNETYTTRIVKQ